MDKKFMYIGLFWLIMILLFVGIKEFTLQTGEEVLLKTQPVDPRDLFRGDYVILRYDITTLNVDTLGGGSDFKPGDDIYVNIEEREGYGVATNMNKFGADGLYMKGKVKQVSGNRVTVEYGIESYFVPEGEGKIIERNIRNVEVMVSVDKFGNSIIKKLFMGGEEVRFG